MVLLILLILVGVSMQTIQNYFCKNLFQNNSDNTLYLTAVYTVAALCMCFIYDLKFGGLAGFVAADGVVYGLFMALEFFCTLQAYKYGSMSLTAMFLMASVMIPSIPSWIFWGDPISVRQVAGIVTVFAGMGLVVGLRKEDRSVSLKWLLFVGIAFLAGGIQGICEKVMSVAGYSGQTNEFIFIGFLAAIPALLIGLFVNTRKEPVSVRPDWKVALATVFVGFCTCMICVLTMGVLEVLPASVTFTVNNGAKLFLMTLIDMLLFKQKLSARQILGLAVGFAGVLLLSL